MHEIPLSFLNKGTNIDFVTKDIIDQNKFYLNPKVVSQGQVRRLVERMVKYVTMNEDKENENNNRNT